MDYIKILFCLFVSDQSLKHLYVHVSSLLTWRLFVVSRLCWKMLSETEAAELLSFLSPETRPDVKGQTTEYILGMSGNRYSDGWWWGHNIHVDNNYL